MILSPYDFNGHFVANGASISFSEERELGQGGPTIGSIAINGKDVYYGDKPGEFGGPFIIYEGYVIAPLLVQSYFSPVKIDINTRQILSKAVVSERLILIKSVDENTVFYYNDLENTILKKCTL